MSEFEVTSAADWRDDRLNMFVYGDLGSGKTFFAAHAPAPLYIATEPGAMTCKMVVNRGANDNFPIIRTVRYDVVADVMRDPAAWCGVNLAAEWPGFAPGTVVVDTINTLEGYRLDEILEARGTAIAEFPEFRRLNNSMMALFRRAWDLKQNTIFIAHDQPGRPAMKTKDGGMSKEKQKGPALTGELVKQGPGIADFYLYFERRLVPGYPAEFVAWTVDSPTGYKARVRGNWPEQVKNPTFSFFRDNLHRALTEDHWWGTGSEATAS